MAHAGFTSAVPYVPPGPPTTVPTSEWPTSTYRPFFLLDRDHPQSLYASVISIFDAGSLTPATPRSAYTYLVDCPSSICSTDFAKQTISHIDGSIWAGQRVADETTTSWVCNLAKMGYRGSLPYSAHCTSTSGRDLDVELPMTPSEANLGNCSVEARSVVVHITAGLDKIYEHYGYYGYKELTMDPEELQSALSQRANEICPASWTKIPTNEALTTEEPSATKETGSSSSSAEETETAEASPTDGSTRMALSLGLALALVAWACVANSL